MYLTALFDSTIHPGNGEVSSSRLVESRTPRDSFLNIQGPDSKSPLSTGLSAEMTIMEITLPLGLSGTKSFFIAISSMIGPHVGSSSMPGFLKTTLTLSSCGWKAHDVISQSRTVLTLRYDEDHPALFLPRLNELYSSIGLPVGDFSRPIREPVICTEAS
nr:uncharacterized protein LOC109183634 [Ipomoea batatas]